MTKTKIKTLFGNKIYMLATMLFFASVFFVGIGNVNADNCSDCRDAYAGDNPDRNCADYCDDDSFSNSYNDFDWNAECKSQYGSQSWYDGSDCRDTEDAASFDWDAECKSQYGSQSWYDGSDCQDTVEPSRACLNSGGTWDGSVCKYNASCAGKYEDQTCCQENGGYWYSGTCNTVAQITQGAGSACSYDSQCLDGYKCGAGAPRVCEVDGILDGTECRNNTDCLNLYGSGFECKGIFTSTCERVATVPKKTTAEDQAKLVKDAASKKADAVTSSYKLNNAKTNKNNADSALSKCGTNCTSEQTKAAEKANTDLIEAQSDFDEKIAAANAAAAAAYPETSSQTGAGFKVCGGGVLAITCQDGNAGTPVVLGLNNSNSSSFGNSGFSGYSGSATPAKCGDNFQDIGGVCFPMTTGLSDAPIYLILSNLFSWLMGLFTTFAVLAFVVSGIQYFMSAGDESMAETAKENATHALIGIIVGLSGFIIIKAIAAALSGESYFF